VNGDSVFYVPNVTELPDASEALRGIGIYIGDGATVRRSMVRKRDGALIGHASVSAQLDWCEKAGVRRAIFTHCGSAIVRSEGNELDVLVRRVGRDRAVDASIACARLMRARPLRDINRRRTPTAWERS
jgi:phosphoribosyl 1,2-cyclic phosphodiesterase